MPDPSIVSFVEWRDVLHERFGSDALFSVDSTLDKGAIEKIVADSRAFSPWVKESQKPIQTYNDLWVMDLTGKEVVLARTMNWDGFALVVDHIPHTQPVVVEEPNFSEDPLHPRQRSVGKIQAMIAISPEGEVFVKTVENSRPVATGVGGPQLVELNRGSKSWGPHQLEGTEVGPLSYTNSARLRGPVQCLSAEAPEESVTDQGWMSVIKFFSESPDIPGKAALITALVAEGLVGFGRV